jgi:hypothetical protein
MRISVLALAGASLLAPPSTHPPRKTPSPATAKERLDLKLAKSYVTTAKLTWSLAFELSQPNYAPVKAEGVSSLIDAGDVNDLTFASLKGYETAVKHLLKRLTLVNGDYLYFLTDGKHSPIMIADDDAGKCLVVIAATDTVYNTLRSSTKQRAAKVLSAYNLPILREAAKTFEGPALKQLAVFVIFGSKDFSSDSVLNEKPEAVAIISGATALRQFMNAEITDQDLADRSTLLVSDRDSVVDLLRVRLTIE